MFRLVLSPSGPPVHSGKLRVGVARGVETLGRRALGCLQHLPSNTAKNLPAEGNMHISSVLRNERPFPKEEGSALAGDLPELPAARAWWESQQHLGTVSSLSWWGAERAGAAATLAAVSVAFSFLIHRSAYICIHILRSRRIDDCFRNFTPGVVK